MKLDKLLIGDIIFQFKYGFYMLYAIFTCLYIIILNIMPTSWVYPMGILLIFSDPSAIGLVFSGAIIQFELSEKTFESLKIAPIKPIYYLLSKIISLTLISLIVGVIIGVSLQIISHLAYFVVAIVLGSLIFSCVGIIIAFKTKSLNHFFLIIIPIMTLVLLPGGAHQFINFNDFVLLHPGISMVEMLNGGDSSLLAMVVLIVWLVVVSSLATRIISHQFRGGKGLIHETNH
jgi:fluoroquinolone transport system permease protein